MKSEKPTRKSLKEDPNNLYNISVYGNLRFYQKVVLLTLDCLNKRIEQGRILPIVNFWAKWCATCIKEIPHFEKLQQEKKAYKPKVLLLSLNFKHRLKKSVIPIVKSREPENEVFLLDEIDQQRFIDRIHQTWSDAIPATLFVKGNKRKFIEKEFTYQTLLKEYQQFK